jgi:hypothetical protein
VSGLRKTLKISKQTFIHGLVIVVALFVIQLLLDFARSSFLLFVPPVGFAIFLIIMYGIQPVMLGVLNIVVLHRFYNCEGWDISFWLNGIFLLLVFSTLNLLLVTIVGVPFLLVGMLEIFLLSYPFGYLAKFSNRGFKKIQSPTTTP